MIPFYLHKLPAVEALKTDFDRPITNLIHKTNNIIEMLPKNEKQDLDKYDIHLSEKLSKLLPEVEDGGGGWVPKQLEFFEGGQNIELEDKVKLIGLSTSSIDFLEF